MCFHYDDYASIYEETTVKTRKPHYCEGCSRVIPAGSRASACSGLFDGDWFRYYVCEPCQRMILSIVVHELRDGCPWQTAWCSPSDLREYLQEREEPVPVLGLRTIGDCRRYVDDLYTRMRMIATATDHEAWFENGFGIKGYEREPADAGTR